MPTRSLPLGLGDVDVPLGTHIAGWYRTPSEKFSTLAAYFEAGLKARQLCLCLLPGEDVEPFKASSPAFEEALASGQLQVGDSEQFYFKNKKFHPMKLIGSFPEIVKGGKEQGYPSVRAAGEIDWRLMVHLSMPSFFQYEERVNSDFFDCYPAIGLCLFDMERYGTEWTLGILRTHPMMVAKGSAFQNPSYYQT